MKHFFARIGRFFWSWGFLKFVLWTITIIVLFYVEEDWRGARAWAATKAKWEAKGETFDYAKFIPPPVPDSENLGALLLFRLSQYEYKPGKFTPVPMALKKATWDDFSPTPLDRPPSTNWMKGDLPDMAKERAYMATSYAKVFKGASPPADPLAQFDAVFPFVGELREASAKRPFCRFPEDYSIQPPASRPLESVTEQIRVSQILTLGAVLALDEHRPDIALEDIKLNQKLALGSAHDPSLVGGLVGIGMMAIGGNASYFGLVNHSWNDAQLAELEHLRSELDWFALYQFDFRAEAAEATANITYFQQAKQNDLYSLITGMSDTKADKFPWLFSTKSFLNKTFPWPGGWWERNKALMADWSLNHLAVIEPDEQRIFRDRLDVLNRQIEAAQRRWDANAPWRIWYTLAARPLDSEVKNFAYAENWINLTRIACALERYRLAHGSYPATLAELVPAYIDAVPHDIMNGEPLHYRVNGDGTFTLYSVGWNGVDDGGKIIFQKGNPNSIESDQGDWVWPTAKEAAP